MGTIFPTLQSESENSAICVSGIGHRAPFTALLTNVIPDRALNVVDGIHAFPLYTYNEDGTNRRDNITDWALKQFQSHYNDPTITKLDIFHYVYGVLHSPEYRAKYAANLKRDLPRIPFVPAPDFRTYVRAGADLATLHRDYESAPEYPLQRLENRDVPFAWRVEAMKLSPERTALRYNASLTLSGIPPEVYDYKLGNRSALDWVIDQYRVSTDARSGIRTDPNNPDDPQYILRLIGQVVYVSQQTVNIVRSLPPLAALSS